MENVLFIIGTLITLIISIFVGFFLLPQNRQGSLRNPFFIRISDYFNVKKIYLLNITKYIFILVTVGCIVFGIMLQISDIGNRFVYAWYVGAYRISVFRFRGLILMFLGPVISRLMQECIVSSLRAAYKADQLNARVAFLEAKLKADAESSAIHKQNSLRK